VGMNAVPRNRGGRKKVWMGLGEGRTMETFAKIMKMPLLSAV